MKQFIFFTIFLFAFVSEVISEWADVDSEWMKYIDGNLKLNQINIPGTHDSGTYGITLKVNEALARTQNKSIYQQLESGVRYLDLRLAWNDKDVNIVHGKGLFTANGKNDKGKDLFLKEVLDECTKFLTDPNNNHSSEVIIAHLKLEDDDDNYSHIKSKVKETFNDENLYYTKNEIPRLNEVKGRIVIATREDYNEYDDEGNVTKEYGIHIPIHSKAKDVNYDKRYISINGTTYDLRVQDGYELELEQKFYAIEHLVNNQSAISQGSNDGENVIAINFMNISDWEASLWFETLNEATREIFADDYLELAATQINDKFINDNKPDYVLMDEDPNIIMLDPYENRSIKLMQGQQYGWFVADFIDERLARYIYKSNKCI